ncbi:MAG: 50S ribosomal protein L18, partial [Gemmatimonadetes bacterium]|nr:50S ribosomal protein L18 [Gemmatimonadota bacterium]NIQ54942.1 50S ribosomal protein L18 [Gemmatimonadota bacterium]NIU75143.1 50S ribosomal protein L18 [Gammaproteobacteria bacterium]NIX44968.1 50S ribosomal protein L18 [Gemmatimonadota bacterium]NIY09198.1 50S ribosomal protein L18 [Gemmatimonadota bacterium]
PDLRKLRSDDEMDKTAVSKEAGKQLAEKAKEAGIENVVFDRGGYVYHGRVAAFAEGAR